MKKINPISLLVFILFFLNFILNYNVINSNAQCFIPASIQEIGSTCNSSIHPTVEHTGNDSRNSQRGASPQWMEVNVFDGVYPGLSFNDGVSNCNIRLPQVIHDPDVVLVECGNGSSRWYALVVYADINDNCILDLYYWNGSTFVQITSGGYPYTLLNSSNNPAKYSTSINIDADENGTFCVVWDDDNTNDIMVQGGYADLYTTGFPIICVPSLNNRAIATGAKFHSPDVSIIKRHCIDPLSCYAMAHITYIEAGSNTALHVACDHFEDWICGAGQTTNYQLMSFFPPGSNRDPEFRFPRIACPVNAFNPSINDDYTSTVVVELVDNHPSINTSDIMGYTRYSRLVLAPPAGICYTSGPNNPCPINNDQGRRNLDPVVTYASSNRGFVIAWNSEYYQQTNQFMPPGILSLKCDRTGALVSGCPTGYQIVSIFNTGKSFAPSLSGRDAQTSTYWNVQDPIQYTYDYNESNIWDVYYKDVDFNSCALRIRNNVLSNEILTESVSQIEQNLNTLLSEFANELIRIVVYDIQGRSYLRFEGVANSIKDFNLTKDFASGLYFIRLTSFKFEKTIKVFVI